MNVKEFGEHLRKLRKAAGLTLVELSKLSGVSHPYLSQIENGAKPRPPSPEILSKLAPYLGVSHMDLMYDAGHLPFHDPSPPDDDTTPLPYGLDILTKLDDIEKYLIYDFIKYKGVVLTDDDKKKLLDYLDYCLYQKQKGE